MKGISEILTEAASTEQTSELASYWAKQYTKLLNPDDFYLHEQTIELCNQESVESPKTPVAYIFISQMLESEVNSMDEFNDRVLAAVRFLDSLLDVINFTPEARLVVDKHRKIALGIGDIEESKAELELPDAEFAERFGYMFSNTVYRASEALGEEKGVYGRWFETNKTLESKSYVKWVNKTTGSVFDGFYLTRNKSQEDINNSDYEVLPRRNSHLLVYPTSAEWEKWSDRNAKPKEAEKSNPPKTEDPPEPRPEPTPETTEKPQTPMQPTTETPTTENSSIELGELVQTTTGRIGQVVDIRRDMATVMMNGRTERTNVSELKPVEVHTVLKMLDNKPVTAEAAKPTSTTTLEVYMLNRTGSKVLTTNGNIPSLLYPQKDLKTAIANLIDPTIKIEKITKIGFSSSPNGVVLGVQVFTNDQIRNTNWTSVSSPELLTKHPILNELRTKSEQSKAGEIKIKELRTELEELKLLSEVQKAEHDNKLGDISKYDKVTFINQIQSDNETVEVGISKQNGETIGVTLELNGDDNAQAGSLLMIIENSINSNFGDTAALEQQLQMFHKSARRSDDQMLLGVVEYLGGEILTENKMTKAQKPMETTEQTAPQVSVSKLSDHTDDEIYYNPFAKE